MTRRHATRASAALATALAAALVLSGCGGGGGGGGDAAANSAPATPVTPPTAGVSAVPTDSLFGSPEAASDSRVVGSLSGYDQFGTPRDGFDQLVSEDSGGGTVSGEPVTGAPVPTSTAPATTTPVIPTVPTTTGPTTTPTTPTTPAVSVLEADFDIGGEPVVARAGDAIPPGTQQFTVEKITSSSVTLKLNGGLLPSGSDTVTLSKGESISLYNQTTSTLYKIRLMDIRTSQ